MKEFYEKLNAQQLALTGGVPQACPHCGAPVHRWPLAWSIDSYSHDTSLSRAFIYQQIAVDKLKIHKAGARSIILFDEGLRFVRSLPRGKGR